MDSRSARHSVFVSYSHRDRDWLDRLSVHLRPLERDKKLVVWADTKIAAGSAWKAEIESAIASAKVAVLLISADFLASDFVIQNEVPPLLTAAKDDGAVILPLIVSPSRFSLTPALAQFQAVNDPLKPLIGLSTAEQEEIFVRLSEAIDRALANSQEPTEGSENKGGDRGIPLIERLNLGDCLLRLGCTAELVGKEEQFIRGWLDRRITDTYWRSEEPNVKDRLTGIGESPEPVKSVERFVDQLLACCAPNHLRVSSMYTSVRKVADAYRLLQRELDAEHPLGSGDSVADKLVRIHDRLLKSDRLIFLPARLLMGGQLPTREDEVCYFCGEFELDVDEAEIAKVPGATVALAANDKKSMYGVVSSVFKSADPFAYPLLRFTGCLGEFPVTMILSRKYIEFGSMTATSLAWALEGRELEFQGIGTIKRGDDVPELHPLACGGPS